MGLTLHCLVAIFVIWTMNTLSNKIDRLILQLIMQNKYILQNKREKEGIIYLNNSAE